MSHVRNETEGETRWPRQFALPTIDIGTRWKIKASRGQLERGKRQ